MSNFIRIISDNENNLKNISIDIPKQKITVFTGVSGSGKSSLVFDTLANESQRLLNETYPTFVRQFMPKYERPNVERVENLPASIVIDQKQLGGNARSTLATITDIAPILRNLFAKVGQPHIGSVDYFSFNMPAGMCSDCQGIGRKLTLKLDKMIDPEKSLNEGAIIFKAYQKIMETFIKKDIFDADKKVKDYSKEELERLYYGRDVGKVDVGGFNLTYEGLVDRFNRSFLENASEMTEKKQKVIDEMCEDILCSSCQGKRLSKEALSVKIGDYNIHDLMSLQLKELSEILSELPLKDKKSLNSLISQIDHLVELGLGYLTLNRETSTLSGGESQRVKLVKHLNNPLTDMLYIFDEPSTGLHPRDVVRMNTIFSKLCDKGNTVLIIEHDPDVIKIADWIVELGPAAGKHGGEIVFTGSYEELLTSDCLTGRYLAAQTKAKEDPRSAKNFLEGIESSTHNLKAQTLKIPEKTLTVVTGVAGSGKSTLIETSFRVNFPDAVYVDQVGVTGNSRSNSATFIGIMDGIRKLFAKENGQKVNLFSYNSAGACESCKGKGYLESSLAFMETVHQICEDCGGKRYKPEVLNYLYNGCNIVDVLDLTVEEAVDFFSKVAAIHKSLKALNEVGLGYITLGQSTSTLSGGEKQRLKLATEFYKKGSIYILDEPSTGLHLSDIERLLGIMNHFVDNGNTLIVIEHQLDIIRQADWIIDVGPDGGDEGGEIIFEGLVKNLKENKASITGKYI
ncbi:MAG: ATP-binding cassette domain-containing protein [Lactovum sp.]